MKKLFVCMALCSMLTLQGYNISADTKSLVLNVSIGQSYTFVGEFQFYYYNDASYGSLNVYEQRQVIDGYLVSTYYAYYGNKYYKLFSCKYSDYNYYISINGSKLYTKL